MRARPDGDGYAEPELLPAPVNSGADESNHWIAPDQSYLLFLSNRAGGIGENDLYISFRDGEGWTAPRNLGAPVIEPAGNSARSAATVLISLRRRPRTVETSWCTLG